MSEKSNSRSKILKIAIPLISVIIIAAIISISVFSPSDTNDEKIQNPNLAVYLQKSQLKCSYLDEINPMVLGDDYPYKKINTGMVNYGKYYDTAGYIGGRMSFADSNTLVYPLPEKDNQDWTNYKSINLANGTTSDYPIYATTTDSEKIYSPDGKYYYIIDTYSSDTGILTACKTKSSKTVFTVDNVDNILGVSQETGEVYYFRTRGREKAELYKTAKGKKEIKVDSGITGWSKLYPTDEAYFYKGNDLYYFNGESSKKILQLDDDYSTEWASDTVAAVISKGNSLTVVVKDMVKVFNCATEPSDVEFTADGSSVFYLDNIHEAGYYVGKVNYNKTNAMNVGDLYKITINGSQISEPELYDTDVSKEHIRINSDGAISYYKNYMLLFSIVNFRYPSSLNIGDFYVNKNLIGENVTFVEYVSKNEIYYINEVENLKNVDNLIVKSDKDIDNVINSFYPTLIEIESPKNFTAGTLKKYDGTQSITMADNVHQYYVKDNGQVLMLIDCDDEFLGELYLYDEKGNIFIDDDVTDIVNFG